ncbi:MAG: hypothetical protein AAF394_07120, partial [Planctomycetota bacterium]
MIRLYHLGLNWNQFRRINTNRRLFVCLAIFLTLTIPSRQLMAVETVGGNQTDSPPPEQCGNPPGMGGMSPGASMPGYRGGGGMFRKGFRPAT